MRYCIDPKLSRFTVQAFASGALASLGHSPRFAVRDVRGEAHYDPADLGSASLRMVVKAASLGLIDSVSEKDRREIERAVQEDLLESARYPDIVYDCLQSKATAVGPLQHMLAGDLTLHGVTRPQQVPVRVFLTGSMLRAQGEATVRQTDYGIRPSSVAGGMLKVKDDVKLTFDIVANVVEEPAADPGAGASAVAQGANPCDT